MRRPGGPAALAAAAVAALLAGAGTLAAQEDHGAPPGDGQPGTRSVSITDRAMVPSTLVVRPGTRIVWRNMGRNPHTVTSTEDLFDSGRLLSGREFSISAPPDGGVYRYYCRFHPFIRGSLTVSPLELTGPDAVPFGTRAGLAGAVPDAGAGAAVRIERRLPGRWEPVAEARTDAAGLFGASTPPLQEGSAFRAVAGDAVSPGVRVGVRPVVTVRVRGRALRASVRPARRGTRVVLERLDLDTYRWGPAGRGRLGAGGSVRLALRAPGVYRARVPAFGRLVEAVSDPAEHRPGSYRDR